MSSQDAFRPTGPTVIVDTTSRQIPVAGQVRTCQYRIRNTSGADAWFTWNVDVPSTTGSAPIFSAVAPVAGTPSAQTIGMPIGAVEIFTLPSNVWMKTVVGGTFEVTPGDGV